MSTLCKFRIDPVSEIWLSFIPCQCVFGIRVRQFKQRTQIDEEGDEEGGEQENNRYESG